MALAFAGVTQRVAAQVSVPDSATRAAVRAGKLHPPSAAESRKRRAALVAAQARWRASGPTQYEYARYMACFCLTNDAYQTVRIQVLGPDSVAKWDSTGRRLLMQAPPSHFTMEGVFEEIARAVEAGAEVVEVRYDSTFGFPASLHLDYMVLATDDELTMRISNLHPLTAGEPR